MATLYELFFALGYHAVMIIGIILSAIFASKSFGWIIWISTAGLTFISLLGNGLLSSRLFLLVFLGLLILGGVVFTAFKKRAHRKYIAAIVKECTETIVCPKCGNKTDRKNSFCPTCKRKF